MSEVPANVTGVSVPGTGSDPIHWKKKKERRFKLLRRVKGVLTKIKK